MLWMQEDCISQKLHSGVDGISPKGMIRPVIWASDFLKSHMFNKVPTDANEKLHQIPKEGYKSSSKINCCKWNQCMEVKETLG